MSADYKRRKKGRSISATARFLYKLISSTVIYKTMY